MKPPSPTTELREAMLSLRQYFKRALLFSFFTNTLTLASALYMLGVYGRVVNSRSLNTLLMLTLLVICVHALMDILDWTRTKLLYAAGVRLDRTLGERVFNATFEARLRNQPVGFVALNDLRRIRGFLSSSALTSVIDAPLLLIVIVFVMSAPLGLFILVAALAMATVGVVTQRRTAPPLMEAQRLATEAKRYASTTLKNAQVIEAMGMMGHIRRLWLARQRKFLVRQAEASDHAGDGAALAKFIQIAQGSMVLGLAAWLTLQGHLEAGGGVLILAWILAGRALQPLLELIGQWKSVIGARDAYARLEQFLVMIPVREESMALPPPKGALSVEAMSAGAPGGRFAILQGVNFGLSPGQVLAVIGPSAAGKSTLARLLVGLWPAAAGKVRLDGVDVYSWNKQELGPHIGYLPQDNELFDGTLAENIARFGDVDRDKVEAAARAVGLHDIVAALPNDYDTPIGAGGVVLSGGERQRVALARAIYGDPQFIVLDEPNSSLDEAGERALLQTLLTQKARGATQVIITHRPNVLSAVDRILVLRDGKMQLFGPRDDVLAALSGKAKPGPAAVPALAAI
jgi:ATP-binding cassette subfamily C exporter for protease/lipase